MVLIARGSPIVPERKDGPELSGLARRCAGAIFARMSPIGIPPALEPDEWRRRTSGAIAVDQVGDETHLVISDPDGQLVSVTGPPEIFCLMALANAALPEADPRKLTRKHVLDLRIAAEELRVAGMAGPSRGLAQLADVIEALLPPSARIDQGDTG